jgi:hypothetical protein
MRYTVLRERPARSARRDTRPPARAACAVRVRRVSVSGRRLPKMGDEAL